MLIEASYTSLKIIITPLFCVEVVNEKVRQTLQASLKAMNIM